MPSARLLLLNKDCIVGSKTASLLTGAGPGRVMGLCGGPGLGRVKPGSTLTLRLASWLCG